MDNQDVYVSELDHLRQKLNAAQIQFDTTSDKTEKKILKERISVLSAQIKIAEDNDPDIIKEREKKAREEAAEKQRLAEQKKIARQEATYNIKRIIGGGLIIALTSIRKVVVMSQCLRNKYSKEVIDIICDSRLSEYQMEVALWRKPDNADFNSSAITYHYYLWFLYHLHCIFQIPKDSYYRANRLSCLCNSCRKQNSKSFIYNLL